MGKWTSIYVLKGKSIWEIQVKASDGNWCRKLQKIGNKLQEKPRINLLKFEGYDEEMNRSNV